jgi:hypothetical protein
VPQLLHPATKKERKPAMSEKNTLTEADLRQFTGSETWYRHGLNRKVLFTDGAKYVADHGGAYWLLDEIALIQPYDKRVAAEEFKVWLLKVRPDHSATLTCHDGYYNVVFSKEIAFTDFPLPEIKLYFQNNTIFLLSEY